MVSGASGIVLGRIGALPVDDSRRDRRGARQAGACRPGSRAELEDDSYRDAAGRLMGRVSTRARFQGGYQISAALGGNVFAPSLFQASRTSGYTLLRLAVPGSPLVFYSSSSHVGAIFEGDAETFHWNSAPWFCARAS